MSELKKGGKRHPKTDVNTRDEHDFATFAANLVGRLISESSTPSGRAKTSNRLIKRKPAQGVKSASATVKQGKLRNAGATQKSEKLKTSGGQSCSVLSSLEDADVKFVKVEPDSEEDIKAVKAETEDSNSNNVELKTLEDDNNVDEDVKPYPVKIETPPPIPLMTLDDEISESNRETCSSIACKDTGQPSKQSIIEEPSEPKKTKRPGPKPKIRSGQCPYCSKILSIKKSGSSLAAHIKSVHTGESLKFLCEVCDQKYSYDWQLKDHWRKTQHKEYDLLKCPHCPETFTSYSGHKYHVERHQEEPKFECPICNKKFHRMFVLNGHLQSHTRHQQSSNPKFVCSLCEKTFISNRDLQEHINRHNGVRPYVCEYCSKAFAGKNECRKHLRLHLGKVGKTEYKCEECDQYFTRSTALKYHIGMHTKSQPFECVQCGSKFRSRYTGKRHWQRRHERKGFLFENCIIRSAS